MFFFEKPLQKNIDEEEELVARLFTSGQNQEMWFLTEDVAEWIEHSNPSKMLNIVDEDEKVTMVCDVTNSYSTSKSRNTQQMLFLTEDGLYEVLMQKKFTFRVCNSDNTFVRQLSQ